MSALHSKTLIIKTSERSLFRSRSAAFPILMTFHLNIRPLGIAHLILPTQPEDMPPFLRGYWGGDWTQPVKKLWHIPIPRDSHWNKKKYNIQIYKHCIYKTSVGKCSKYLEIIVKQKNNNYTKRERSKCQLNIKKTVNYSLFLCSTYKVTRLCFIGV